MPQESAGTLKIGDPAPEFELISDQGQTVRPSDLRGKRVLLYFYPKDDTPGCTAQSCGFRDAHADLQSKNVFVLGISPDGVKSHQRFRAKYGLPFTLLADPKGRVARAYGVWAEKTFFGRKIHGVVRSHFVIDEGGRLADVQVRVSPDESVERALQALA